MIESPSSSSSSSSSDDGEEKSDEDEEDEDCRRAGFVAALLPAEADEEEEPESLPSSSLENALKRAIVVWAASVRPVRTKAGCGRGGQEQDSATAQLRTFLTTADRPQKTTLPLTTISTTLDAAIPSLTLQHALFLPLIF